MNKIIGITLIAPLLLGNMQTTTVPKPTPKPSSTSTTAKPAPTPAKPTPVPAKPATTTPVITKPSTTTAKPSTTTAKPSTAKPTVAAEADDETETKTTQTVKDDAKSDEIPIVTLKKPSDAALKKPVFTAKAGESAEDMAQRGGADVDIMCFMTLGTFSAVAGRNVAERSDQERQFLSKVDAATDFFMGRASVRLAAAAIEPAMRKAGVLITADSLGPMSEPCLVYYDEVFAPFAAQIKSAPPTK